MRILLLGHRELASNLGLSLIAATLKEHQWRIMLSTAVKDSRDSPAELRKLTVYEESLCDQLDSEAVEYPLCSFRVLAARSTGSVDTLSNPNSVEGLRAIRDYAPDLIISCRYRRILKEEAIAIPPLGVINLHSGLLPSYRGVMATFWAMLAGEKQIGSTLHYISDAGIDTGAVIAQRAIALDPGDSYLRNVLGLYPAAQSMVARAVSEIGHTGKAQASSQQGAGQYFSAPAEADLVAFAKRGLCLFDGCELDWLRAQDVGANA